jgi:hypothetical protein
MTFLCKPRCGSIPVILPVRVTRLIGTPDPTPEVSPHLCSGVPCVPPATTDGAGQKFPDGVAGIKSSAAQFAMKRRHACGPPTPGQGMEMAVQD